MMRLLIIALLFLGTSCPDLFGQFSVTSTNKAYTVKVDFSNFVVVNKVNSNSNPPSFTYQIRMNYLITVTGTAPNNDMYDLRGVIHGLQQDVSFNLPRGRTSSSGTVTTATGTYVGSHTANLSDLMRSIEMVFQWNEIPWQTVTIPYSPLPVELLSFDAVSNGKQIELSWSTASERNNNFFTVERTTDGINYEFVAEITGAGNSSSIRNYTCTDRSPLKGNSYYRLTQTDFNGTKESFEPKSVYVDGSTSTSIVYPNPAVDSKVNATIAGSGTTIIRVYSVYGQLVKTQTVESHAANETVQIELPEARNTFFVELIQNDLLLGRYKVLTAIK